MYFADGSLGHVLPSQGGVDGPVCWLAETSLCLFGGIDPLGGHFGPFGPNSEQCREVELRISVSDWQKRVVKFCTSSPGGRTPRS